MFSIIFFAKKQKRIQFSKFPANFFPEYYSATAEKSAFQKNVNKIRKVVNNVRKTTVNRIRK
jgi:hypothetical protein